jgi:gluconolactonase
MIRCRLLIAIAIVVATADLRAEAQLLPSGASVTRLVTGYGFTEGPLYDGAGGVYFSDMNAAHIVRYDIASGTAQIVDPSSGTSNGLIMDPAGHVISADRDRQQVSRRSLTDIGMVETVLADNWMGADLNGPNDLVMDAVGGLYFTDPDYENRHATPEAVYYLDPAGTLSRLLTYSTSTSTRRPINKRPNGIALSPDGSTLYVAVEWNFRIMAYDVGSGGTISNERLFARTDVNANGTPLSGIFNGPDGLVVDVAGNVYSAVQNAVFAWSPSGERLFDLSVPQNPTNVTIGGPEGRTLFITAATSLYGIELNVPSPALGDFNGDGTVSAADYTVWRNTLGTSTDLSADGDGDRTIDEDDYDVWREHFGATLGSGGASTINAVPEPSGIALWCFTAIGGLIRRRRKSRA